MRTSGLSAITVSCLAGLLVLLVVSAAGGKVVVLTPSDMGVIQNPEVPNDSRFLIRFEPSVELSGARVDLAVLEFTAAVSCPDSTLALTLDAFAVTSPWDGQSVEWNGGWDTPGGDVDRELHAVWTVALGNASKVRLDVTDMAQSWVSAERANHGLLVGAARGELGAMVPHGGGPETEDMPTMTIWYTRVKRR